MTGQQEQSLKRTPFFEVHRALGARFVGFGGWEMPVYYTGINEEHLAVRQSVGIFDVSHMGEAEIHGSDALQAVQYLTTNDASRLRPGQVQYSVLCNERGGIVDDITVYRLASDRFMFCINAANTGKDLHWLKAHWQWEAKLRDLSEETLQLAIQGPSAEPLLQKLTPAQLTGIPYYGFVVDHVAGVQSLISRTGYTGEDGFEIYYPRNHGIDVWEKIVEAGISFGLKPCGLGARDTLRLEMQYALYGNDLDDSTTPLEAGLAWVVRLDKGNFLGVEVLRRQKEEGIPRKLIAFELLERAVPRSHYPIFSADRPVGQVTSGTFSPCLQKGIGMGYISSSSLSDDLSVEIRGKKVKIRRVTTSFWPSRVKKPPRASIAS